MANQKTQKQEQFFGTSILIALLFLLGIALRFAAISSTPFWYDELATRYFAGIEGVYDFFYYYIGSREPFPAPFFFLQFLWVKIVPDTELWFRIPALSAGLLSLWAIYYSAKKIFNHSAAAISLLWVSLAYSPIWDSTNARPYSFLFLASTLFCLYSVLLIREILNSQTLDKKSLKYFLLSAIALGSLHYFGILLALIGFSYLLILSLKKAPQLIKPLIKKFFIWVLCLLPWIPSVFLSLFFSPRNAGIKKYSIKKIFYKLSQYSIFDNHYYQETLLTKSLLIFIVLVIIASMLFPFLYNPLKKKFKKIVLTKYNYHSLLFLTLTISVPLMLVILKNFTSQPAYRPRYLIISMPALYFILGRISMLKLKGVKFAFIILPLVLMTSFQHLTSDIDLANNHKRTGILESFSETTKWVNETKGNIIFCRHFPEIYSYYLDRYPSIKSSITTSGRCRTYQQISRMPLPANAKKHLRILSAHKRSIKHFIKRLESEGYKLVKKQKNMDFRTADFIKIKIGEKK